MSLRKSSRSRKGSKSEVLPNPKARRKCTPAPSRVGLERTSRLMGRRDILTSSGRVYLVYRCSATPPRTSRDFWNPSDWGTRRGLMIFCPRVEDVQCQDE